MDTQSIQPANKDNKSHMNKSLRKTLTILNCLLLMLGNTGGPCLSRLYFNHGGHRQWLLSFLETAGFPILLIPLIISYYRRRSSNPSTRTHYTTPKLFMSCAVLGLLTGLDDFLYAYGLSFLPVSTSALLLTSHLIFTSIFAFLIVKQKFSPFSVNAVAMLTIGSVILGSHGNRDRPANVTNGKYFMGFSLTLGTAALYGLVLPLIELTYMKAKQVVSYTLVMEVQFVMGFFATLFCAVGMLINHDFQAIPEEARQYELGPVRYYVVLIWASIFWQFFFLGAVGVIFYVDTLLAAIIIAMCIPITQVLGVIFYHEPFSSEKGVALVLSLWGMASYSYGDYLESKRKDVTHDQVVGEREDQVVELGVGNVA